VPHRHRLGRLHAPLLPRAVERRGAGGRARRHRGLGAPDLRLDGTLPGLQGRLPRHARGECRLLRAVPGQRAALLPRGAGARAVHEPRAGAAAGGPSSPARRGGRRLRARRAGDRRRPHRQRRQGGGDRLGADALQLHRASEHQRADQEQGVRTDLHGADERAGREAHLPAVLRHDRGRDGQPLRLPAVESGRRSPSSRPPASSRGRCCTAARGWP